jgi:hypothetical protein
VEPFASAQLVVSYCSDNFGASQVRYLNLTTRSLHIAVAHAAGPWSAHHRLYILLRLLRRRMASSLRSARARKLFQSGRHKAACRGAADSGAHEKLRDYLHNLQQAPSDARQRIASVAPARKGRTQGQVVVTSAAEDTRLLSQFGLSLI